jgi:hypothetical protein
MSFFLNLMVSLTKTPLQRKTASTLGGLFITFYAYGVGVFYLIPYNMIGYICMAIFPRKQSHYYVIFSCGFLLTFCNIIRQYINDLGYSVATLMMITFVKQSMLATNYRDGNGDLD